MSAMTEREKILKELDELFKINLNGGWAKFKNSCAEIKEEFDELTIEQMRALKDKMKNKLELCLIAVDTSTQISASGDVPAEPSTK
jgi:hypothetical protein